jgi:hypothetical protein
MPAQKISFMVPPDLWQRFKEQTDGLFINRAPFMDLMISEQIPYLKEDLNGITLGASAKRYIAGMLKKMGAKSVNIEISSETAESLNQVVLEHNLVRNAFLCRLIIFLRGNEQLLRWLKVPLYVDGGWIGVGLESMSVSPMGAMQEIQADPLFYIRNHVQERHGRGLYNVRLPPNLDWAACFLDESDVPNKKNRDSQASLARLL